MNRRRVIHDLITEIRRERLRTEEAHAATYAANSATKQAQQHNELVRGVANQRLSIAIDALREISKWPDPEIFGDVTAIAQRALHALGAESVRPDPLP